MNHSVNHILLRQQSRLVTIYYILIKLMILCEYNLKNKVTKAFNIIQSIQLSILKKAFRLGTHMK